LQGVDTSDSPICQKHITCRDATDSSNTVQMGSLPHVVLQLRSFSAQVHLLVQSHDGNLPLARLESTVEMCNVEGNCFVCMQFSDVLIRMLTGFYF